MNITTTPEGIHAVSSLEIAKLTGKRHADVLRNIENILNEAKIDQRKFASIRLDVGGREQPYFLLPRFECDLVISGYSVKYRAAIIRRWHELEALAAKPPTRLELARAEYAAAAHAELLGAENEILKPVHEYGSFAPNGLPRVGIRRASFVAGNSRISDATRLWELRLAYEVELDRINGQLRLAI
jgi:phage regulator Rha-like protein